MFTQPFKRSVRAHDIIVPVLLLFLATLFLAGCGKDKTTEPIDSNPSGVLISATGCKDFVAAKVTIDGLPHTDCMQYQYSADNILLLQHINAGFNCCTDPAADITFEDNVITITESESGDYCYCLCLVDLELKITNLPPGEYTIKVVEMYLEEGDELLEFTVDLADSASGSFCVQRDHYPWGYTEQPLGRMVDYSGCGGFESDRADIEVSDDQNCMEYHYDGGSLLKLRHLNGRFNCCPEELLVNISVDGDLITVTESEWLDDGCYCLCLYDLDYEIENLPAGSYAIQVIEPYLLTGEEALAFTVELNAAVHGIHCVNRLK
jgi:hypothetical protein